MPAAVVNAKLKREIVRLKQSGRTFPEIAAELSLAVGTVKTHYYLSQGQPSAPQRIPESRYTRYDAPPIVEGDALILPDVEVPFQNADFLNRVLELADAWGIKTMIAAGDLMHMDSISGWEPNWSGGDGSRLSEADEARMMAIVRTLPKGKQAEMLDVLMGIAGEDGKDFSSEMAHSRAVLSAFNEVFDSLVWIMGNHEGRLLRAINSPVNPSELLNLMRLDNGKWKIGPYYWGLLKSGGETFRITHPKGAGVATARSLAIQYHQHILMGHSHHMAFEFDPSGDFYAIHMGHCVDEARLCYASQRDARRDAHKLGAVIVRDGHPWLLHEGVDWLRMKGMK